MKASNAAMLAAVAVGLMVCGDGPAQGATATGGTVTTNNGYVIHTFTNGGVFDVNGGAKLCDVLVVGGGGGGGGAGGVIYTTAFVVAQGTYPVVAVRGVRQTGPRLLLPVMLGMPREGLKRYVKVAKEQK